MISIGVATPTLAPMVFEHSRQPTSLTNSCVMANARKFCPQDAIISPASVKMNSFRGVC